MSLVSTQQVELHKMDSSGAKKKGNVIEESALKQEETPFIRSQLCSIYKGEFQGNVVAIKEFFGTLPLRQKRKLRQEAESLRKLNLANIVKFYGITAKKFSIVTEFLEKIVVVEGEEVALNDVRGLLDNLEDKLPWQV